MLPELIYVKKDLATVIARETGFTKKKSQEIVETVFEEMKKQMSEGNDVQIYGFGKFEIRERAARKGINPATKETIEIPATKVVGFKPAKALKERVKHTL